MNIGLGQIIIIVIILILLWGNIPQLIRNVSKSLNDVLKMFKKDIEQGEETHDKDRKI